MKAFTGLSILGAASVATAHTLFSTLFINGENQGDGTCIRMPKDGETATGPIYPITGDSMACGRDGGEAVPYICPAPSGATLTFDFRIWPNGDVPGVIDSGHKGPCAVYVKKVDDMFSDSAAGPGWFKIWEDGYDVDNDRWCVDTLIEKNGLLSVNLPQGLPAGYYLVRPEVLALHAAYRGDPQFFLGCAQIFVQGSSEGELDIPDEYQVSIPGYIDEDTPGITFDMYQSPVPAYPLVGPELYRPSSALGSISVKAAKQQDGAIPKDCILKNANWCATPIASYSGEDACWAGVDACYAQSKECWASAPPTGSTNCYTWSDYCAALDESCAGGDFDGPAEFEGHEEYVDVPGSIPEPWGIGAEVESVVSSAVVDEKDGVDGASCESNAGKKLRHKRFRKA